MGKNKTKSHDKDSRKSADAATNLSPGKVTKSPKQQQINDKLNAVIKSVGLPANADGLTADQLTENQKHVLKKVCAKAYGHQHTERRALPANSLESATAQLAEKMKQKLAQKKKDKKQQKQKSQ